MSLQVCLSIVGLVAALIIIGEWKFRKREERKRTERMMQEGRLGGLVIPTSRRSLRFQFGKFVLYENGCERPTRISIRKEDADVACTLVTREAVEELKRLFDKHFPKEAKTEVEVQ